MLSFVSETASQGTFPVPGMTGHHVSNLSQMIRGKEFKKKKKAYTVLYVKLFYKLEVVSKF